jgi:hypothetical protein
MVRFRTAPPVFVSAGVLFWLVVPLWGERGAEQTTPPSLSPSPSFTLNLFLLRSTHNDLVYA